MTPKQKLKSLEQRMNRIQKNHPEIDFKFVSQRFFDVERYYKLRQDYFKLKFDIEHCQTCGKKL